jgi:ubiquinone/menaquinone biosynthesis C-methylase UbiE
MADVTQRFSNRVETYIKYRPGYPDEVIETLRAECGLTPHSIIADIGSGTGILTEMFLKNGNPVYGVEPNREMREAGERLLKGYPHFHTVAGKAEETTLADAVVDFIVAGQAFHWFDREKTRAEFMRILKPKGWIALIWNERLTTTTPFLVAYEELLKTYATDYEQVDHRQVDQDVIRSFFGSERFQQRQFKNVQVFDYEGVEGRLLSSSYAPEADHPHYKPMMDELRRIFQANHNEGEIDFEYQTSIYFGQLD